MTTVADRSHGVDARPALGLLLSTDPGVGSMYHLVSQTIVVPHERIKSCYVDSGYYCDAGRERGVDGDVRFVEAPALQLYEIASSLYHTGLMCGTCIIALGRAVREDTPR